MNTENEKKPEYSQQEMETVLHSSEARELLRLLQQDGGTGILQVREALKRGDYTKAAAILKPLLDAPNTELLMQKLSQKLGRS